MITVRLPATLQVGATDRIVISEALATIAELIAALDRRMPGFYDQLEDGLFNFAVNDEIVLYHARDRALADGDVVELVPAIAGG
jgi:molybdopterin converting factor small subunit